MIFISLKRNETSVIYTSNVIMFLNMDSIYLLRCKQDSEADGSSHRTSISDAVWK